MASHRRLTYEQAHRHMYLRLIRNGAIGLGLIAVSLFLGTLGYHEYVKLAWIDSFMNAAMILSSMGPVDRPSDDAGKIFASLYALYSGVVFVAIASLLVMPVAQRMLHRLHMTPAASAPVS